MPTRVLAKTARLMREVRTADTYGISVSHQAVNWPVTVARVRATVERVQRAKAEPQKLAAAGVDLLMEGRARFTGPHEVELAATGRRVRADSVIICVGGRSRRLPIPGAELATLPEQILDLPSVPRRLAVVGAGNTGAQLVTVFGALGADVTLLDKEPRILAHTDAGVSAAVAQAFVEQGVRVETSLDGVVSLVRSDDGIELTWRCGGEERRSAYDAVVTATGWPASVEGSDLEAAGVTASRGGIPVDEHLRTNVQHIYAAATSTSRPCSSRRRTSRPRPRPATPCSGRGPVHRTICSPQEDSPTRTTREWASPRSRPGTGDCVRRRPRRLRQHGTAGHRRPHARIPQLITDSRRELLLGAHAVGEQAIEVVSAVTASMQQERTWRRSRGWSSSTPRTAPVVGVAARQLMTGSRSTYEHATQ